MALGPGESELEYWFCLVTSWALHTITLNLSLFICKAGVAS